MRYDRKTSKEKLSSRLKSRREHPDSSPHSSISSPRQNGDFVTSTQQERLRPWSNRTEISDERTERENFEKFLEELRADRMNVWDKIDSDLQKRENTPNQETDEEDELEFEKKYSDHIKRVESFISNPITTCDKCESEVYIPQERTDKLEKNCVYWIKKSRGWNRECRRLKQDLKTLSQEMFQTCHSHYQHLMFIQERMQNCMDKKSNVRDIGAIDKDKMSWRKVLENEKLKNSMGPRNDVLENDSVDKKTRKVLETKNTKHKKSAKAIFMRRALEPRNQRDKNDVLKESKDGRDTETDNIEIKTQRRSDTPSGRKQSATHNLSSVQDESTVSGNRKNKDTVNILASKDCGNLEASRRYMEKKLKLVSGETEREQQADIFKTFDSLEPIKKPIHGIKLEPIAYNQDESPQDPCKAKNGMNTKGVELNLQDIERIEKQKSKEMILKDTNNKFREFRKAMLKDKTKGKEFWEEMNEDEEVKDILFRDEKKKKGADKDSRREWKQTRKVKDLKKEQVAGTSQNEGKKCEVKPISGSQASNPLKPNESISGNHSGNYLNHRLTRPRVSSSKIRKSSETSFKTRKLSQRINKDTANTKSSQIHEGSKLLKEVLTMPELVAEKQKGNNELPKQVDVGFDVKDTAKQITLVVLKDLAKKISNDLTKTKEMNGKVLEPSRQSSKESSQKITTDSGNSKIGDNVELSRTNSKDRKTTKDGSSVESLSKKSRNTKISESRNDPGHLSKNSLKFSKERAISIKSTERKQKENKSKVEESPGKTCSNGISKDKQINKEFELEKQNVRDRVQSSKPCKVSEESLKVTFSKQSSLKTKSGNSIKKKVLDYEKTEIKTSKIPFIIRKRWSYF